MLPKLGLVSIGVHDDVLNWVAKYKPVSIIIVNERGQSRPERPWENSEIDAMRKAMGASPKTLWIVRSWPDGIGEGPDDWPLLKRLVRCFEVFAGTVNPLMAHSYNEPGFPWIQTSGDARKLMEMEKDFAKRAHDVGLLSMNFCFSESHILKGNMGLWSIFAEALPYVDALGFNEYDWPWVFTSRDQGYKWRIGHWEHQVSAIQRFSPYGEIPPVIIGEGILDGKIKYPHPYGWQKEMAPNIYVREHQAVHDDTYHKLGLFSHHTFCYCHESSEWRSYNVKVILPQLGQLITDQQYWSYDQGGGSMDVWGNVERYRPDVAKFKNQVGDATKNYPVPIPDYKGVAASPAKTMAVIIAHEGNPANPNQVVEFDEKKDGKPTGRKLHAVGLCGIVAEHTGKTIEQLKDPYTNITEGLKVLQSKLKAANGVLRGAYYYYTGGSYWPSMEEWINKIWLGKFVPTYKQFWGVNLEPAAPPEIDHIGEAEKEIDAAQSLLRAADQRLDKAKEHLALLKKAP